MYIFWLNDSEIEVLLDPRNERCSETKVSSARGLVVKERPLLERAKAAVLGLENIGSRRDGNHE